MKIAIVEDQKIQSDLLKSLLEQFHDENYSGSAAYEISVYNNGEAFLKAGALAFDMVFMDIEGRFVSALQVFARKSSRANRRTYFYKNHLNKVTSKN